MTPLHYLPLATLVADMRAGRRSAEEVTAAHLQRIAEVEPRLHAFAHQRPDEALADARALDARRARGQPPGPLHGAPIAVKDLCAMAGTPTRAGGLFPTGFGANHTATVVRRLQDAGAVVIGKAHLTEGAWGTHHPAFPAPVNPWAPDRWTGSSSSGSGVAVAAGMAAGAIGTDTAGSIRFPSACNGLVGLKPTWGRISRHGVFPLAETFDHLGPMTRTVRDAALMFAAMAGPDPLDPTSLPATEDDWEAASAPGSLAGTRIGVDRQDLAAATDPVTRSALERALAVLAEAGAAIVDLRTPAVDHMLERACLAVFAEAAFAHARHEELPPETYTDSFRILLELGRTARATDLAAVGIWRRSLAGEFARLFAQVDAIAMPVLPIPPLMLAEFDARRDASPLASAPVLRFTLPLNLAGIPSLTLPMGRMDDGTPLGFQLAGPALGEAALLRIGAAYEAHTAFADDHPPLEAA